MMGDEVMAADQALVQAQPYQSATWHAPEVLPFLKAHPLSVPVLRWSPAFSFSEDGEREAYKFLRRAASR